MDNYAQAMHIHTQLCILMFLPTGVEYVNTNLQLYTKIFRLVHERMHSFLTAVPES